MMLWIKKTFYQIQEKLSPISCRIVSVVMIMFLMTLVHMFINRPQPQFQPSNAEILKREQRPKVKISEFAVSQTNIFIHYEKEGLVEAYDLDGYYCYSIRFKQQRNGVGHIGVSGETLYIQDRLGNLYMFEGSMQVGYKTYKDSEGIPQIGSSLTLRYSYKQGKIIRNKDGYTVLDLSENSVIRPFLGCLVVGVLILVFSIIGRWNKRVENKPIRAKHLGEP